MPDLSTFLLFMAALIILEITPGPDMMLVLARGIGQGPRTALLTVFGMIFVAGPIQVALLALGVASLLQTYPLGLTLLQWLGAIYLIALGARLILSSLDGRPVKHAPARSVSNWSAVRQGAINSLTNPKTLLFMFAFLPQFVDPASGPIWLQLVILGTVQKLAGVVSLGAVAVASGKAGQLLAQRPGFLAWQERFTGAVMIGLGLRLLLTGAPTTSSVSR